MSLSISEQEIERMRNHAESGYPEEICGLLLGRRDDRGHRLAEGVRPAPNLNRTRARDRYELDPAVYLDAEREARARGREIVGIYHTHPDHPPIPSETDRLRAADVWGMSESWSYVILGVDQGRVVSWRSWVLLNGLFIAEDVEVISAVTEGPNLH